MPTIPPASQWQLRSPSPADDDLIGIGADLEPGTLLLAYAQGLFPMPLSKGDLGWWSPVDRGILPLDGLKVSRSLRQAIGKFEIRVDTSFREVMIGCGDPSRDGSWIEPELVEAYCELHDLGWAHSVETWRDGELVGGLYGVTMGGLFAGESMFSRARDASKVALVALVDLLRDEHADQRLLDTQWQTPHLATLGVIEIPRSDYLARLQVAKTLPIPAAFS